MYNNNGRPLTRRQTVRILVLLTLLAWATQTLLSQWGFSQEVRFVPSGNLGGAVIELKSEVTLIGSEVTLRQIARWSDADDKTLAPVADLIVLRLTQQTPYKSITMDELRGILGDAGVNLAIVRLAGATRCTVARTDVRFNEGEALNRWLDAKEPEPATRPTAERPALTLGTIEQPVFVAPAPEPIRRLRDLIAQDLATRLHLPVEVLQLSFNPKDDRVLNLSEGVFKFGIEPVRARDLGNVTYDITLINNGNSQKATIQLSARAWQQQLVVTRPIAFKQVIRETDVQSRRTLIDRLPAELPITLEQTAGNQAARELKPGTVVTAKLVEAVPMVRTGQLVTVSYTHGTVQLRSVARALEGGTFGQSVRCKNDTTGATFEVVLTGPQTATMGPVVEKN